MSILDKVRTDQVQARKDRDEIRIPLLTTLLSEASNVGLNDGKRESTDAEVIAVIKKFIKNIDETLAVRPNEVLETERAILEQYLPTQLTGEKLEDTIRDVLDGMTYVEPRMKMMGPVMKALRDKFDGQYDGKEASTLVRFVLDIK